MRDGGGNDGVMRVAGDDVRGVVAVVVQVAGDDVSGCGADGVMGRDWRSDVGCRG